MGIINNISKALGFNNTQATPTSGGMSMFPKTTPVNQPVQQPVQKPVPVVQKIQPTAPVAKTPVLQPIVAPSVSQVTTPTTPAPTFKLDTTNITSDHLAGDNTLATVLSSLPNPYANSLSSYQQQAPTASQYSQATQFSPAYLEAQQNLINQNQAGRQIQQNYLGGVQNVMGRPEAMDFQQGQEAALTRQNALLGGQQALNIQAATEGANLQELIRQNNIAATTAQQTGAQNQFTNAFNATQGGLNYGIQQGQLGVSQYQANTAQQTANQGRYEYQQITDPNTGFPVIQILDKQSGLPVGSVSPSSPVGQQIVNSRAMITGGTNNGIINGYNITSYATDPNHEQAVSNWYQAINNAVQGVGGITDANTAQAVIGQLAPNSPVTGQMIINSAQKYGVDPALMVAIMQQDSQLGTKGLAVRTFNPGNVGNTGSAIKNMGSWEKGVDSVAQWLSTHRDSGQSNPIQGNYQQVVSNAPAQLQSAIKPLPDGSSYIDSSLLARPEFGVMAQNYASQNGIRVLNSADAATINTVIQSIKNMQILANTFGDLASNSAIGAAGSNVTDFFSKALDTNYGSQLKSYQANREGLFQQIRALAGSSPRLNGQELTTAANSMPTLDAFNKNTLKDGVNKLVKTQSYLDNAIRTFVPSYVGTPVAINGQYAVLGSDGKAYQFPDNNSALQFLKAMQ